MYLPFLLATHEVFGGFSTEDVEFLQPSVTQTAFRLAPLTCPLRSLLFSPCNVTDLENDSTINQMN